MSNCNDIGLKNILVIVKNVLNIIHIIGPIICIIALIIAIVKITNNPDDKKLFKNIRNIIISLFVLFFIPMMINVVMDMLGEGTKLSSCWNSSDKVDTNSSYIIENNKEKNTVINNSKDYEKGDSRGPLKVAELAVRVAPYASPNKTTRYGPINYHNDSISAKCGSYYTPNPWFPPSQVDPKYKDFEKIMDAVINDKKPGNRAYGSCAQAAGGIIRAVVDPDFETTSPEHQIKYLDSNTSKWTLAMKLKPGDNLNKLLEPGDLLVTDEGWTHTMIYVGNEMVRRKFPKSDGNIFQAGYDDCDHARYPRIDKIDVTPVPFRVYRPTGSGNFKYEFIDIERVLAS